MFTWEWDMRPVWTYNLKACWIEYNNNLLINNANKILEVFKYCLFPSLGLSSSSHTPPIVAQILPPSPIFQLCDMNRSEDWSGSCLATPCLELEVELVVVYYYIYILLSVSAHRNEKRVLPRNVDQEMVVWVCVQFILVWWWWRLS